MPASYRIIDEPEAGPLAAGAIHPMWPLLALMFGGAWIAWPWFLWNGFALGSATRRREAWLVLAAVVGAAVLALGVGMLLVAGQGGIAGQQFWWVLLLVTLWKLGVSYWLFELQQRSFDLLGSGGLPSHIGPVVVVASLLLRPIMLAMLPGFWKVVLG